MENYYICGKNFKYMHNGYFRAAACAPRVSVADCDYNVSQIVEIIDHLNTENVDLIVFPEMCISAYTCGDLFHSRTLLDASLNALQQLLNATKECNAMIVVGAPLEVNSILYNCAIVIVKGKVVGVVPKSYIPNYNEFYEKRWWAAGNCEICNINLLGCFVPIGINQIFEFKGTKIGVEICEDLWTPIPPSCHAAMAGAEVIVNLSASDDLIGKYSYLTSLISQQSARCLCGYVYAGAGYGESSTDLVFDGKTIIAENGTILHRNKRWQSNNQVIIADIDIMALRHDRMHIGSFNDCKIRENHTPYLTTTIEDEKKAPQISHLYRSINPTPFVPPTDDAIAERCQEIINIQVAGLAKRLDFIRCKSLVVGISGGLDSTLALLVAAYTFDRLKLNRKGILGITMPGFGTTDRTHDNAIKLMQQLGVSIREISIVPAVEQHFKDIGHDKSIHDVTYENSQARERTQLLMDIANKTGGIVLGTGDLSELALGWATYNGDHMSMYGVNAGVPKTLVKYLVKYFANDTDDEKCRLTLLDIIDTPISPELTPADSTGNIAQKTEDLVGPYELHDFFLYYTLRYGFTPDRIFYMAQHAFADKYSQEVINKWLKVFFKRFFQQQFKRSCLPDGPKVGSVCLSPRGDWRMPSDASSKEWLNDLSAK